MTKEESTFYEIGSKLEGTDKSQMFGKPFFKINGKAFICFFQNEMDFKLDPENVKHALTLSGSVLFEPYGKDRQIKEWDQIPGSHYSFWDDFALKSLEYLKSNKLK